MFTGFFILVGLAQAWLFGGNRPRKSSVLVGATLVPISFAISLWQRPFDPVFSTIALIWSALIGTMLGYAAGGLVAGFFMLLDTLEDLLTGNTRQRRLDEHEL